MTYDILTSNSEIIDVDHQLSLETGLLHAEIQRRIIDFGLRPGIGQKDGCEDTHGRSPLQEF